MDEPTKPTVQDKSYVHSTGLAAGQFIAAMYKGLREEMDAESALEVVKMHVYALTVAPKTNPDDE